MQCRKVRGMLVSYLAGECRPAEQRLIEHHLTECVQCSSEKASLELLDGMLDTWSNEKAPPGITADIMSAVQTIDISGSPDWFKEKHQSKLSSFTRVLRDLTVAAAVTLVVFWAGGGFFSPGNFNAVGENVNGMARSYSQMTTAAVEKMISVTDDYNGKINFEEWDLK